MSNTDNIYNILNNFNKIAKDAPAPVAATPKAKTKLQESMEQVVNEKYMGFKKTVAAIKKGGSAENPEAVAAAIGRKKYGKEKFQKAAAAGKKLGEGQSVSEEQQDESALQAYIGNQKYTKKGMKELQDAGREGADEEEKGRIKDKYLTKEDHGPENPDAPVNYGEYDREGDMAKDDLYTIDSAAEELYSILQADENLPEWVQSKITKAVDYIDTARDYMKAQSYGQGVAEELDPEHVEYLKRQADVSRSTGLAVGDRVTLKNKPGFEGEIVHDWGGGDFTISGSGGGMSQSNNHRANARIIQKIQGVAEGFDDMIKDVNRKAKEKGTGKFDKKEISTGTVYTRKYNPKSGETDDTENVSAEKRGRGRPKKSAFEDMSTIDKMIAESFGELFEGTSRPINDPVSKAAPTAPGVGSGIRVTPMPALATPKPATTAPGVGSIQGGVWTAKPPKPGQQGVPVPQGLDEVDAEMEGMRKLAGLKGGQKKLDRDQDGELTAKDFSMLRKGLEEGGSDYDEHIDKVEWLMGKPNYLSRGEAEETAYYTKETDPVWDGYRDDADEVEENLIVVPNPSGASSAADAKKLGAMMPAKPGEKDPISTNEDDMEEGNAFSKAVVDAKKDGVQPGETISVGGKEYDLREGDITLNQMRRIAGLKEGGMSPISGMVSDMKKQQGSMNISTNQSSDGTKSVTITANGDAAGDLMQMLKLAGMGGSGAAPAAAAEPEIVVVAQDGEEAMEEEKDPRYQASTTPDEQVAPVQALTKGGNGDVAGQEKTMKPGGYQFGDNNLAMQESLSTQLMKEYNSIKVKK